MVLSAPKSLQLLGMHALTGCDGTSYPYARGKVNALKTILTGDFSDLDDVLGEEGVTQADLMKVAITFPLLCMVCHGEHPLSQHTSYCKCSGKDGCCNQYTNTEDAEAGDESAETGGCR